MRLIEDEFAKALGSPVRHKVNRTRPLSAQGIRQKAKRVANGAPEVMVKVTGFGKGAPHVKAHLSYISRNGKLEMENDRGELFHGREEVKTLFDDWQQDFADSQRRKNQRDTMHLILSMPESTDPQAVKAAAREFAGSTFGKNHEYAFVLHTDEPHPHVHVTVKTLGFNGRRLHVGKDTVQEWRDEFAEAMRKQGVDAEATPRRARGVVKKPEKQVVRHIRRGDKTHKPRMPKVWAIKVKEAVEELLAESKEQPTLSRPWEERIKEEQAVIRTAWLAAATELKRSGTPDDRSFAERIKGFVAAMPKIDTERHEMRRMLLDRFARQPGTSLVSSPGVRVSLPAAETTLKSEAFPTDKGNNAER